jgi:hypothetical protein
MSHAQPNDTASIFRELLSIKGLTTYEKLLCVALIVSTDREAKCEPSVSALARLCACSPRQIARGLSSLEAKGHITRAARFVLSENDAQTTNSYLLRFAGE